MAVADCAADQGVRDGEPSHGVMVTTGQAVLCTCSYFEQEAAFAFTPALAVCMGAWRGREGDLIFVEVSGYVGWTGVVSSSFSQPCTVHA